MRYKVYFCLDSLQNELLWCGGFILELMIEGGERLMQFCFFDVGEVVAWA